MVEWLLDRPERGYFVPIESESELLAHLRRRGRAMPVKDSLIAASALAHGRTAATLNIRDFEPSGVSLVDPRQDPSH